MCNGDTHKDKTFTLCLDEVLEVNGIEVSGKTLDQVTDMMVANSSNLIITVKPANQRNTLSGGKPVSFMPRMSTVSTASVPSLTETEDDSDEDEVKDLTETINNLNSEQGGGDERNIQTAEERESSPHEEQSTKEHIIQENGGVSPMEEDVEDDDNVCTL